MPTVPLVASAARTATGNSGALPGFNWSALRAQLAVTAASGTTPTLDVVIEDSLDGTNWNVVGTFTQATAATAQAINISGVFADQLRVRWTVAGTTPSFTFAVLAYGR